MLRTVTEVFPIIDEFKFTLERHIGVFDFLQQGQHSCSCISFLWAMVMSDLKALREGVLTHCLQRVL